MLSASLIAVVSYTYTCSGS